MTTGQREFSIIVWGASGFTGKLTAEYLLKTLRRRATTSSWALGGRNRAKLEQVRKDIGERRWVSLADALPIVVGDSDDAEFLAELARRTDVVCTTVGPYAKYGSKLVAACVEAGTELLRPHG